MRFYEGALGGKLGVLLRSADTPMAAQMPPKWGDRIMHARLVLSDGGVLYGGDAPTNLPFEGIKGVSITLNYDTTTEAEAAFAALAEGGQVTMPIRRHSGPSAGAWWSTASGRPGSSTVSWCRSDPPDRLAGRAAR